MSSPKAPAVILVAEDDAGHGYLIEKNLRRSGLGNPIIRLTDGQQVLDFIFGHGERKRQTDTSYLLLLDIRMPKVDGVEVLRQIKQDAEARKIPVTMLTTTDDPREVERCHLLGCSSYIVKPLNYEKFAETIQGLGLFVTLVEIPEIKEAA